MNDLGPFELGFRLDELEEKFMKEYGWGRYAAQKALARRLKISDSWIRYLKLGRAPSKELRGKIYRRLKYVRTGI